MNYLLSYCGLVDERISTSEKDLPVQIKLAVWMSLFDWSLFQIYVKPNYFEEQYFKVLIVMFIYSLQFLLHELYGLDFLTVLFLLYNWVATVRIKYTYLFLIITLILKKNVHSRSLDCTGLLTILLLYCSREGR